MLLASVLLSNTKIKKTRVLKQAPKKLGFFGRGVNPRCNQGAAPQHDKKIGRPPVVDYLPRASLPALRQTLASEETKHHSKVDVKKLLTRTRPTGK